jgi:hypothetical protein
MDLKFRKLKELLPSPFHGLFLCLRVPKQLTLSPFRISTARSFGASAATRAGDTLQLVSYGAVVTGVPLRRFPFYMSWGELCASLAASCEPRRPGGGKTTFARGVSVCAQSAVQRGKRWRFPWRSPRHCPNGGVGTGTDARFT